MKRPNRFLFDEAVAAFEERGGRLIVELGAIRSRPSRKNHDGQSTLRWPDEATVWSVDTDPEAIRLTHELTAHRPNVFCVLADGLAFLKAFPVAIDMLYLDGPHPDRENGRQWHFDAYKAATMRDHAVLLIDDTDLPRLGKAEFVVPAALEDGFHVISSDRQTLLAR